MPRRTDKLDSEWVRRGGDHPRQFIDRRSPGKGSGLARREPDTESTPARSGVFTIGNENGIHCQPHQRLDVGAAADLACDRERDRTPICRDWVGTGFVLTSARLVIGAFAKIEDERLGLSLGIDAFNPRASP